MSRQLAALVSIVLALSSSACFIQSTHEVQIGSTSVEIPSDQWRPAKNSEPYADNFEARALRSGQVFPQMLTIYKIPMSDDRRSGIRVSDREFAEFFVVHPGKVTVQIQTDKGKYWILSRETFEAKRALPVNVSEYSPFLTDEQQKGLWSAYQDEVDATRALINGLAEK